MRVLWDEPKRLTNIEDHNLDFADAERFDWVSSIVRPSHSRRFRAIGMLDSRLVAIIFAPVGTEAISIISMRQASKNERKIYGDR